MSFITKLVNPAFYQQQYASLARSMTAYYSPLFQSGSVKPLWHMMIATSVIMYTQNYVFNKGPKIQAGRQEQKKALEEYYANHGISHHH
eukprot:CCRYP_004904-RA/>CCRYP_004904-RA protein AED:0.22 eAED:0.22 QI:35/1/1/1/1/1/3/265/88